MRPTRHLFCKYARYGILARSGHELVLAIWARIRQTVRRGGRGSSVSSASRIPDLPPDQHTHAAYGATYLPTETAPRSADASLWDTQDLTSERDAELDTITADEQIQIRRIADELVNASPRGTPLSS